MLHVHVSILFYISVTKLMWFRERVDKEKPCYSLDEMLELIDRFVLCHCYRLCERVCAFMMHVGILECLYAFMGSVCTVYVNVYVV